MLRIITIAAAAALVTLTSAGTPVRAEGDCDAVTKRALREFKTTLDQHKERWVEFQGTMNDSDPVVMQLCNFYKIFPTGQSPDIVAGGTAAAPHHSSAIESSVGQQTQRAGTGSKAHVE